MPTASNQYGLLFERGGVVEGIGSYLLSVFTAALVCGIATRLMDGKGTQGAVVRMIAGIFLTFTVIRPMADITVEGIGDLTDDFAIDASAAALEGERITKNALASGIKSRCEAYILDKAHGLNANLTVEVSLTDDDIPIPCAVRLSGKISPYAKTQLQAVIENDLGIEKENQLWT